MATSAHQLRREPPTETLLGPFETAETAARYAETHDIGEAGPPADLPAARGGTVTVRLEPETLRQLRQEALRRRTPDLAALAAQFLTDALAAATHAAPRRKEQPPAAARRSPRSFSPS